MASVLQNVLGKFVVTRSIVHNHFFGESSFVRQGKDFMVKIMKSQVPLSVNTFSIVSNNPLSSFDTK